jgi:hypothetical protein
MKQDKNKYLCPLITRTKDVYRHERLLSITNCIRQYIVHHVEDKLCHAKSHCMHKPSIRKLNIM